MIKPMKKTEKIKYEIDPANCLVIAKSGRESKVPRFREVLDGTFKIGKNNALLYHIKSPSSSCPKQLKLAGNWSLGRNHNLLLTLDNVREQYGGNTLTLNTEIIDAKADKLELSVSSKDTAGKMHFYILRLSGRWQADKYNRLSFLAAKSNGPENKLTLSGAWEANKQNELVYTYIKESLKTKDKICRTITFKGYWDISKKLRVSYILNEELNSGFEFKVSLGKPAKRGLEYEIGIGKGKAAKTFTLFGSWKINKLGLLFEMPYTQGKIRALVFGATCKLNKNYTLDARLKNNLKQDLGIDLKLTRKILGNQGEAFLQAFKENKEIALVAGAGFRW